MASHFSANQYENAFDSRRLQNWQLPKTYKERPDSYDGFTQIVANNRGHLKDGVPRSTRSPWGEFVGTWDMPRKIPGNITTYVARGQPAVGDIKTKVADHERYMEDAKSPKKGMSRTKMSPCRMKQKTPPPLTQLENGDNRPGNPEPPSNKSSPKSPSPNSAQISPRAVEPKTPPITEGVSPEPIVA